MSQQRNRLVAGNWKMNGLSSASGELEAIMRGLAARSTENVEMAICPPATLVFGFAERAQGGALMIGGQDCHAAASGAHTGDVAAEMLADAGATLVIVGHSERRADHGETNDVVRAKAEAAARAGLKAIICVGETEAERDAGRALEVVTSQALESLPEGASADQVSIAYEPVWAIGTGRTAEASDIAEMHGALRSAIEKKLGADVAGAMRLLYGGSVKPGNAAEIFNTADVDGGLIGGASLKADDFLAIVDAAIG